MKSLEEKFMEEISRIKEVEIFLGISKLLSVELLDGKEPRDFTDVFADVMEKFRGKNRARKKELLKVLKLANKESLRRPIEKIQQETEKSQEEVEDGNRTENTEA